MGVTECDNMLMTLGVSQQLSEKERDIVVPIMMKGFRVSNNWLFWMMLFAFDYTSYEAGTQVTGGQSILNPWLIIGGTASSVCQSNEYIM